MKVCLVGSSGGHLTHLMQLEKWWKQHDRIWVTFKKEDAVSLLDGESTYWCHYPTNRNLLSLIKNTLLAFRVLFKEKPDIIVSAGAAAAVPFFYLGKLWGTKLVFIEVYDRIDTPSLTGRLVYPLCDEFIVQWEEQKKFYPKSKCLGGIF